MLQCLYCAIAWYISRVKHLLRGLVRTLRIMAVLCKHKLEALESQLSLCSKSRILDSELVGGGLSFRRPKARLVSTPATRPPARTLELAAPEFPVVPAQTPSLSQPCYSWRGPLSLLGGTLFLQLFAVVSKLFHAFGFVGEAARNTTTWARVVGHSRRRPGERKQRCQHQPIRNPPKR